MRVIDAWEHQRDRFRLAFVDGGRVELQLEGEPDQWFGTCEPEEDCLALAARVVELVVERDGKVLVDEQALRRELEYFGNWCFWDGCQWSGEGSPHTGTCPFAGGDR